MSAFTARVASLDVTKGALILLMTISHIGFVHVASIDWFNHYWLFLFKLPCFYIVSGYLMGDAIDRPNFIWKKFDGLVKPYMAMVFLVVWPMSVAVGHPLDVINVVGMLLGYNYEFGDSGLAIYPAWFITNLFVSFVICYGIARLIEQRWIVWLAVLVVLLLLVNRYETWNFFHVNTSVYAVIFIFTGYFLRRFSLKLDHARNIICFVLLFVVLRILFDGQALHLDIAQNEVGNFLVVYSCALLGSLSFIGMAYFLKNALLVSLFCSLSRNSLFILVLHVPLWRLLQDWIVLQPGYFALFFYYISAIVLSLLTGELLRTLDGHGWLFKARAGR